MNEHDLLQLRTGALDRTIDKLEEVTKVLTQIVHNSTPYVVLVEPEEEGDSQAELFYLVPAESIKAARELLVP